MLGSQCSRCCGKCFSFSWFRESPIRSPGSCLPGVLAGTVILEIPESIEIPEGGLQVTFTVLADDKVRVNGDWFGNANECQTTRLSQTIFLNQRTITFDFFDTACCGTGTSVPACVCISGFKQPAFDKTMLSPAGGTIEIEGWKLTYPSIPNVQFSPPGAPYEAYLAMNYVQPCEQLNPLP